MTESTGKGMLRCALNNKGERVHINDAQKGTKYFCELCKGELITKQGKQNAWHFAHKSKEECDSWGKNKTAWHIAWQDRFPKECQEFVINAKHRADVFYNETVIEFQHSAISSDEVAERNCFYTSNGNNMAWLFDMRESVKLEQELQTYVGKNIDIKSRKFTFCNFDDLEENVSVFFEVGTEENTAVFAVSDITPKSAKVEACFTIEEFVRLFDPEWRKKRVEEDLHTYGVQIGQSCKISLREVVFGEKTVAQYAEAYQNTNQLLKNVDGWLGWSCNAPIIQSENDLKMLLHTLLQIKEAKDHFLQKMKTNILTAMDSSEAKLLEDFTYRAQDLKEKIKPKRNKMPRYTGGKQRF